MKRAKTMIYMLQYIEIKPTTTKAVLCAMCSYQICSNYFCC